MDIEDPVLEAVKVSMWLSARAGLAHGHPGTEEFLKAALAKFRERQALVWSLPADPDELLRQQEADAYESMLADPAWLTRSLIRLADAIKNVEAKRAWK